MHTFLGHEDWIRDIDVCLTRTNELFIASCGQDCYIRIWRLIATEKASDTKAVVDTIDEISDLNVEVAVKKSSEDDDEEDEDVAITLKSSHFTAELSDGRKFEFSVGLETVLYGHEDWIYSVKWHPLNEKQEQPLMLLSASIDKTMVLWKYDESNALWLDIVYYKE